MKKLYTFLLAFLMVGSSAMAQTNGYNRLKNVATGHIVNLDSRNSFAPDATEEEAHHLPGTVALMGFEDNTVTSLKAQNVDLVNVVIPMVKEMVPIIIDEPTFDVLKDSVISMANSYLGKAMATVLVGAVRRYTYDDFLTYVEEMDTKMYYKETGDGNLLYVNSPKFPLDAGDLTSYVTNKINGYLELYYGTMEEMADEYLADREQMSPMVYSMIEHFRFGDCFYLVEQNHPDYGAQFGFANSLDIDKKGASAKWNFIPVDNNENYFGVKGQYQDANGKWYASFVADFGITLPEGMTAWYVTDEVDAGKSLIQRKKVDDTVLPGMIPLILELNGPNPEDNKLTLSDSGMDGSVDEGNALEMATDSLGFLLGRRLEQSDTHYYVLGVSDGKVSLVQTENTFLNPNEAFFYLDDVRQKANTSGYLVLADKVDAIHEVAKTQREDNVYYDLQGRVVRNPVKGIYILNGKKVVLR